MCCWIVKICCRSECKTGDMLNEASRATAITSLHINVSNATDHGWGLGAALQVQKGCSLGTKALHCAVQYIFYTVPLNTTHDIQYLKPPHIVHCALYDFVHYSTLYMCCKLYRSTLYDVAVPPPPFTMIYSKALHSVHRAVDYNSPLCMMLLYINYFTFLHLVLCMIYSKALHFVHCTVHYAAHHSALYTMLYMIYFIPLHLYCTLYSLICTLLCMNLYFTSLIPL